MPRKKLKRIIELASFPNVLQEPLDISIGWHLKYFGNNNPVTLETACGKGEYTVGLARKFPGRNFIGIDRKGGRIYRGAKIALEENLRNAMFLRTDAERIGEIFVDNDISEIWIAFPDPFPKKSKASRRLTSPRFLEIYRRLLKPKGAVHLKTDDDAFFAFTLKSLKREKCVIRGITLDLYGGPIDDDILSLKTTYERRHLEAGRAIKYVRFGFIDQAK
jgi:tRNA (guanine-N7-)-methyltransferase